ncbi:MAG: efflux RND transporter periplasmic adaptor subunit, partial [Acidobacteriota bacterium]
YERHFDPGDVNPSDEFRKLFTIIDLSKVWVKVEAYEKDLLSLAGNPTVEIRTDAYPRDTFRATFHSLGSEIDPANRTLPVYFEVPNPGDKLRIGLRVRVGISKEP